MPISSEADEAIKVELNRLSDFSIHQLRERWRSLFRTQPPPAFGPDLLRRSIAQRLQEYAYDKLSTLAQRELNRIIAMLEKSPNGRLEIPRRIKPGAVLVRDWKTKSHRVMVLDDGFGYEGHLYASLSEIAGEITGTHWNGPRFFGLRPNSNKSVSEVVNRKRGRPPKQISNVKSPIPSGASHGL